MKTTVQPSRLVASFVLVALVFLVWLVFGQTLRHDFVNFDDNTYVYGNSLTAAGLNWHGVARAFVDTQTNNWHPLTLISHMLDCELFDLKPGAHHFTNVLLHTVAAVLLFLFLRNVTAQFWSSAFVAALFAIHPLRVESVAWVAERKDVLSAVFFCLTLIAYSRYVTAPSFRRYVTMSILFALGLMSKPMLVTTPVILLLLDYWPFKRFTVAKSFWHLAIEKIPLFGLSLVCSVITLSLQLHSPALTGQLPFAWRLENALVSYVIYIRQIFLPVNLAVFYPHPDDRLGLWQVGLSAVVLIAATWIAFVQRRSRPYLLVGWLWYLVVLLPVIGVIQVGLQSHADRYTYLPHVGLYVAFTWLIVDLSTALPYRKQLLGSAGTLVVIVLSFAAWKQTTHWRDSETLWRHTLAVTSENEAANTNLGMVLSDRGQFDDALSYLQTALAVRSQGPHHYYYDLRRAIVLGDIGEVLARKGDLDDAIFYFRQSIELKSDYPFPRYNLGATLFRKGDMDGAIAEWQKVLSIQPGDPQTLTNLANAFVLKGKLRDASAQYEKALQAEPENARALNNFAWMLATATDDSIRDGARAVALAEKANQISSNPLFIRTLAAACAEAGHFDAAVESALRASKEADGQGQHGLAVQIEKENDLYRRHLPLRDPGLKNSQ